MSIVIIILAVLAGIIGIAGSILPGLPGPPISWAGLLILHIWGNGTNADGNPMTTSKEAGRGAIIGLIVWMFVPPVGIILGTLGGAFLAEFLVSRKDGWESTKSAVGALLGFFFGTGIKLIASGLMMYYIIVFLK